MYKLVVKDGQIIYVFDAKRVANLTEKGLLTNDFIDSTTTTKNATEVKVSSLPKFFEQQKWQWNKESNQLEIIPEFASELLSLYKQEKLKEINETCQSFIDQITTTYPEAELLTFDKQEAEAREYTKDKTVETPLLTALAVSRGLTLDELATRVLKKADAFTLATGTYIGQRQKYEDRLMAAETIEDVLGIVPEYFLPN